MNRPTKVMRNYHPALINIMSQRQHDHMGRKEKEKGPKEEHNKNSGVKGEEGGQQSQKPRDWSFSLKMG